MMRVAGSRSSLASMASCSRLAIAAGPWPPGEECGVRRWSRKLAAVPSDEIPALVADASPNGRKEPLGTDGSIGTGGAARRP